MKKLAISMAKRTETPGRSTSDELALYQKIRLYHARVLALSMAIGVSPIAAIFWQRLMARSMLSILAELGLSNSQTSNTIIQTVASFFAVTKFVADETAINPLALADNYIYLKKPTNHYPWHTRWLSIPLRLISLSFISSVVSLIPSLVLSKLVAHDVNAFHRKIFNLLNFVAFLLYGLDYYWAFHKEPIEHNLNANFSMLLQVAKNVKFALHNANKLIEILLTTTLRSSMRALTTAFIIFEASNNIFEVDPRHPAVKLTASITALVTFMLTFFFQIQKKNARYFNKAFESINTKNVIASSDALKFTHWIPAITRGMTASIFTFDLLSQHIKNGWILAAIGFIEFSLFCGQSLYIDYQITSLEQALSQASANSIKADAMLPFIASTKTSLSAGDNELPYINNNQHYCYPMRLNENSPLVASASTYSLSSETSASSIDRSQLFDELAALPYFQPGLPARVYAYTVSIMAQLLQCICAYFIVAIVSDIIELGLRPVGIAALSLLLSSIEFKEDVFNSVQLMLHSQTNQNVAYGIETQKANSENQHMFFKSLHFIKNRSKAWLVSPIRYSADEMNAAKLMR